MAIIRQRLPIPGPFDIRLGLPRDKGFDPQAARKRLNEQKTNPNTTINRFRSMVAGAEGLYRPAKFLVIVEFPKGLSQTETFQGMEFSEYLTDLNFMNSLQDNVKDRLYFFCDAAQLPDRTIVDTEANSFYGPVRHIARGMEYSAMTLSFMLDSELTERAVFEAWQNMIVNQRTFNMSFYDEYVSKIYIFPLHENKNESTNTKLPGKEGMQTGALATLTLAGYYVELIGAYPKTLAPVDLNYNASNTFARQSITFNYRYWTSNVNLRTLEDTNYEGDINGTGVIKDPRYMGIFGGILGKLPPEIQRAGRDVINQIKTRFPLGRIFGGRVFPPFF